MRKMMKFVTLMVVVALSGMVQAAGGNVALRTAVIDSHDNASLQRGARLYVNYCAGCHSLKYVRFNRLAQDLDLTEEETEENLMFVGEKIHDFLTVNMPAESAGWFGKQPPDLSLVGRSRGKHWLFSYLTGFYADPSKPTGMNNTVFKDVGMPHVLQGMQGTQVKNEQGALELIEGSGSMSAGEYDKAMLDLVNFLDYAAEPIKNYRSSLGWYVIAFLLVMLVIAYLLKKEFWKDIH